MGPVIRSQMCAKGVFVVGVGALCAAEALSSELEGRIIVRNNDYPPMY